MSPDREAVVWTRLGGMPVKMGRLLVTDRECRFTYTGEFIERGLPGLGLVLSPAVYGERPIVRRRTERFDLLPPLQALVPPRDRGNFQRNLALRYLQARGHGKLEGFDADWAILMVAGHGGIGHLDVFEDDEAAHAWYEWPRPHRFVSLDRARPLSFRQFLAWFDEEADLLLQLIGPTPSIGGAIPKLLVSIPETGWDGRIGPPTREPVAGVLDVVLKFEQTATYPGIVELEALALDMHARLGFDVPRHWQIDLDGVPALAVERFDRDAHHRPRFVESLFSVIASGNPDLRHHYDFTYDGLARALGIPELPLVSDTEAARVHLFRRLVAALVTGNGDLHLENLSLWQVEDGRLAFSPVYDPTPMRAYPIHDLLNAMPFGRYGEYVTGREQPVGFDEALQRFARACGLGRREACDLVHEILEQAADYPDRIEALKRLPGENKAQLIAVHRRMRDMLASALD
ncbi:MAG TPA: type II toxin-antitoxin system HipA family toxin [Thiotrichales bacterium]|nr:type II toxin-antitoxin system HipA family toxin [Thiotrichales bacterium]